MTLYSQIRVQITSIFLYYPGFENLQKAFSKAKNVIEKEGKTPTFFVRCLVEMEDFISQVSKPMMVTTCIW